MQGVGDMEEADSMEEVEEEVEVDKVEEGEEEEQWRRWRRWRSGGGVVQRHWRGLKLQYLLQYSYPAIQ